MEYIVILFSHLALICRLHDLRPVFYNIWTRRSNDFTGRKLITGMRQRGVEKLLTCALYGPCLSSCNRRVTVKPHRAREGVRVKDGWMEDHLNPSKAPLVVKSHAASDVVSSTGLGKRVVPRLRELVPCSQRESGGRIHAT